MNLEIDIKTKIEMNSENSKPGKIYSALNAIMSEVEAVPKDQKNVQQGYSYRGIDSMYAALHGLLAKHKVFATKEVLSHNREERTTPKGTALIYVIMEVRFTYHAEDGSFVTDTTVGEAMDSGDKASNKAMSSAFKYSLMQVFAIPTKEDKDTEKESPEVQSSDMASAKQIDLIKKLSKSHVFIEGEKGIVKLFDAIADGTLTKNQASKGIEWLQTQIEKRKEEERQLDQMGGES